MPRFLRSFLSLTTIAVFAVLTLSSRAARADVAIAGDIDYGAPTDSSINMESGPGFAVRLGYHAHIPLIVLTPEVGFSYYSFSGDSAASLYRGLVGARIGIGEIIRPGVFVHLGYGKLDASAVDRDSPDPSHGALAYDAGAFLDFTLLPIFNIGIHGAYNGLNSSDNVEAITWGSFGAHAELVF